MSWGFFVGGHGGSVSFSPSLEAGGRAGVNANDLRRGGKTGQGILPAAAPLTCPLTPALFHEGRKKKDFSHSLSLPKLPFRPPSLSSP